MTDDVTMWTLYFSLPADQFLGMFIAAGAFAVFLGMFAYNGAALILRAGWKLGEALDERWKPK